MNILTLFFLCFLPSFFPSFLLLPHAYMYLKNDRVYRKCSTYMYKSTAVLLDVSFGVELHKSEGIGQDIHV